MQTNTLSRIFQYGTRFFILIFATYLAVMHQLKGVLAAPNAHAYCPFGGLESVYKFLASGGYIQKIMPATMVLFVSSVLLVVVLNRAFCGWICPLGTLQMLFDRLARFLKIKKIRVPAAVERYLHYVKYIGLVVIIYFTWKIGDLVYDPYDPWSAYAHIAGGLTGLYIDFFIGSIFLIVALIGSLWLPNNFCRYFCPMGAFLGILSKLSPTRIHRNETTCINCKKCDRVCPAQIAISTEPKVKSMECFACGDCVAACPVDNTLMYRIWGKRVLNWLVYGIATLVIFFGVVEIAKLAGIWKTSYSSATEVLTDDSGAKNPANIKGSMTLEMVSKEFNIPVEAIVQKFKLPENTKPGEMLKNIATANNLSTETFNEGVRTFVAEYLKQSGTPTAKPPSSAPTATVAPEQTPGTQEQTAQPATLDIRGKTTIEELIGYGMTKERFKEITGVDMPADQKMLLKDFATANNLDIETLKTQFIKALQQ
jgi:polyferredoxin